MKAMVLEKIGGPLREQEVPMPVPSKNQVLIKVRACGVCRTDRHIYDGDIAHPKLPLILGHQIVGEAVGMGRGVHGIAPGQIISVPWLGQTCGTCAYCDEGRENLCDHATFTGYQIDGGYAEYTVADYRYCLPLPENISYLEAAPLSCAGLVGYRALRMTWEGDFGKTTAVSRIGFYGFGASAHILTQIACYQGKEVYAFTRPGDWEGQAFAREVGAVWAGDAGSPPDIPLDAAIIFAPVGDLIPAALRAVKKGGVVICAGIHMSNIPSFPYDLLWGERSIRSVSNLTRQDGIQFFALTRKLPLKVRVETFKLTEATEALDLVKAGRVKGAAVLAVGS